MNKKRILIISLIGIIPFMIKALDSDSRSTREVILKIDAEVNATFTDLFATKTFLCEKFDALAIQIDPDACNLTPLSQADVVAGVLTISTAGSYCLSGPIVGEVDITASNVEFDGNGYLISGGTIGIDIVGSVTNVVIKNAAIRNVTDEGIRATNCGSVVIKDSQIINASSGGSASEFGILLSTCSDCHIRNVLITASRSGVGLISSNNNHLEDVHVMDCVTTSFLMVGFDDRGLRNTFDSCSVQGSRGGAGAIRGFLSGFTAPLSNIVQESVFRNCTVQDMSGDGDIRAFALFSGTEKVTYESCTAANINSTAADAIGFTILQSNNNITYIRCQAFNASGVPGDGWSIDNGTQSCISLRDCDSFGNSDFGFQFGPSGGGVNCLLEFCTACDNGITGFEIIGRENCFIHCISYNNGLHGFNLTGASTFDNAIIECIATANTSVGAVGFSDATSNINHFTQNWASNNTGADYSSVAPVTAFGASPEPAGTNIDG